MMGVGTRVGTEGMYVMGGGRGVGKEGMSVMGGGTGVGTKGMSVCVCMCVCMCACVCVQLTMHYLPLTAYQTLLSTYYLRLTTQQSLLTTYYAHLTRDRTFAFRPAMEVRVGPGALRSCAISTFFFIDLTSSFRVFLSSGLKPSDEAMRTADPVCAAGWSVPTGPEENYLHWKNSPSATTACRSSSFSAFSMLNCRACRNPVGSSW